MLYPALCRIVVDVGVGHAWPWELDQLGPRNALQLSYKRAMEDLTVAIPDVLYVDGNSKVEAWSGPQIVEPKADINHKQVSVASIIAKHLRDTMMVDYARERRRQGLPDYNWEQNKGYGTQDHMDAIAAHGLLVDANDPTTNHSRYLHRICYCKKLRKGNATG
jgi:ribonuclease HII